MQEKKHYKLHKVKKRWVTIAVTATAATVLFAVGAQTQADQVANPQEQTTTTQTDNQSDKVADQEVNTQASAEQATAQTPSQDQTPAAEQKTTQETPEVTLNQDSSAGDQGQADQANQNNQSQDAQKSEANPSTDNAQADAANQTQEGSKDQATATEADNGVQANSFYGKDGKWYYADANKQNVTGWQTINGQKLYFNEDGSQVKGREITDNGATYYFDQDTGDLWTNRFANQQEYDFDILATDHDWYYYGQDGKRVTGWQTIDGKKMYFTTEDDQKAKPRYSYNKQVGSQIKGRIQTIDGKDYFFAPDTGEKVKNQFVNINFNNNRYYNPVFNGWLYFGQDGAAVQGWQTIDGKRMYFLTNKDADSAPDYARQVSAQVKDRLQTIDGKDYYFDNDGVLQTNKDVTINGKNYHLNENGVATAEDLNVGGHWEERTLHDSRTNKDFKANVYVDKNGTLVTGLQTIDGKKYYFFGNGEQAKDTIIEQSGYRMFYLAPDTGEMVTDKTIQVENVAHFRYSDGMDEPLFYKNGWLHFGADGLADSGYRKVHGYDYNLQKDEKGSTRWKSKVG